MGKTLFEKIWDMHVLEEPEEGMFMLAIDRIYLHDLCGTFATQMLKDNGYKVRRPESVVVSPDHTLVSFSKDGKRSGDEGAESRAIMPRLRRNCKEFGIELFDIGNKNQGIMHIIGPEQGRTLPGMTLLCGDSHTVTHGAMGCLAMGVGTSEVYLSLATNCLLVKKPKTMQVVIEGERGVDIGAMDIILALIAKEGIARGTGYAIEYCGSVIRNMTMDERFTLCNLTIEMGAEYALIAPDNTTIEYLKKTPYGPKGDKLEALIKHCKDILTDSDAKYDATIKFDITNLKRQVTWGINPGMGTSIEGNVPDVPDNADEKVKTLYEKAYNYMGYGAGTKMSSIPIQRVFVGACSNGRISQIRDVARIAKGNYVAENVEAWVVPGSESVKQQAIKEGLDVILRDAGFKFGEPSCSLCCCSNGEHIPAGEHCVSTTNRNFLNRQGRGACTHLASPITAAKAAIKGYIN